MYAPSEQLLDQVERSFVYHPPIGDQADRYSCIRSHMKEIAFGLLSLCPPSRELSLALTDLQGAMMWANAAIACNEKPGPQLSATDPSI